MSGDLLEVMFDDMQQWKEKNMKLLSISSIVFWTVMLACQPMYASLLGVIMIAASILVAYQQSEEKIRLEQKQYELKITEKLSEMDDKILEMMQKADRARFLAKAEIENQIKILERENTELDKTLQKLERGLHTDWVELKERIEQQLADFDKLLDQEDSYDLN